MIEVKKDITSVWVLQPKLKNELKEVRHIAYVKRKTLTNMISILKEKEEETRREAADVVKKADQKIIETESRPK